MPSMAIESSPPLFAVSKRISAFALRPYSTCARTVPIESSRASTSTKRLQSLAKVAVRSAAEREQKHRVRKTTRTEHGQSNRPRPLTTKGHSVRRSGGATRKLPGQLGAGHACVEYFCDGHHIFSVMAITFLGPRRR